MITTYKVKLPDEPTIKDYIKFFKAIPAEEWCIKVLQDKDGRRCANGHANAFFTGEAETFAKYYGREGYKCPQNLANNIVSVNNKSPKGIKTRVIGYLKSLV